MRKAADVAPLELVKTHLRIGTSQTAEDSYLKVLTTVAGRSVEHRTGRVIFATHPDPSLTAADMEMIGQVMLLLIGGWYWNRESVSPESVKDVPLAVGWLLEPLRTWTV